ncbi:P-II family nitrogen regulator [Salipaludibacillus agaradhaerens]|uniref:P-II family nitrogen regulator n=1 Tax=Salipaludibacillus agaradhaerens TaxID=76935 RepID=UPI0009972C0E|nr:P-II family nitrogen regulator [Salipaludibacillus agaradhaerens]MCR6106081.1 P-II family nitrogen regulator [Salipaludibacillus agaradhaerens]MCR6118114.1 P-II family nitrogen regulator [Salipaludibacillus agaradhaerens]
MTNVQKDHKLLVTIIKKGKAKKIMKAAKSSGAEGGTILFGSGRGIRERAKIFGLDALYEKELVLNLVPSDILPSVLESITSEAKLNEKGQGIGFIIDIKKTIGIAHMTYEEKEKEDLDTMTDTVNHDGFDLIITIVNKGDASKVINASTKAGAEGGTVINGRGSGIHEKAKLLSIAIEPEKDVVLTLIKKSKTKDVLSALETDVKINDPGKGISFVLPIEQTIGIHHLMDDSTVNNN